MEYSVTVDQIWPGNDTDSSTVHVKDSTITSDNRVSDPTQLSVDAEYTVLTPGWINSHAHLELSGCPDIEYNGNFVDWIFEVIDFKQNLEQDEMQSNYSDACDELLQSGVCHVVDHCDRTDWLLQTVKEQAIGVTFLKELIAFTDDQRHEIKSNAAEFLTEAQEIGVNAGFAPHAPYSAHPKIYEFAAEKNNPPHCVVSSHLHELKDELSFTEDSDGIFCTLLEERTGKSIESPYESGRPIQDLVKREVFRNPTFGVHMNYLTESDYRWLESSQLCPVVCPRSYSFFGHETDPVNEWIRRDIPFAIGTDSMASNYTLNMIEELQHLNSLISPGLYDPELILESLTEIPSRVIGSPDRGVLTQGTPADFSIFNVPSGRLEDLARGKANPLAVIRNGEIVWADDTAGIPQE